MKIKLIASILAAALLAGCAIYQDTVISETESITDETFSVAADPSLPSSAVVIAESTESTELTAPEPLYPAGTFFSRYTDPNSGAILEYYTYVPDNASDHMPLVLFLHGDGEMGKPYALEHIALVDNAASFYGESFPFIAIAPCRMQKSWCTGQMPHLILAIIQQTVQEYNIDADRIVLTGFSSGAMGAWYLLSYYPDQFSACVPISCPNEYPILYDNIKKVPIRGFVGEKEPYYVRKMSEIINWTSELGGDAMLTVIENMPHAGMDKAAFSKAVIDWMIAQ